ncbi:MAG: hypothetical protein WBW33_34905 [Bryobacteraceae bacterium]
MNLSRFGRLSFALGAALWAGTLTAQDITVYVHSPGSSTDGELLPGNYSFPDTAEGNTNSVVLRFKNTGTSTAYLVQSIFFSQPTPFQITGDYLDKCLAPGGSEDVTAVFAPTAIGPASEDLSMSYAGNPAASGCPVNTASGQVISVSTFHGTGLASIIGGGGVPGSLTLSYLAANGSMQIVQSGGSVSFGRIEEGTSSTVAFTLTNSSAQPITAPPITVSAGVFTLTSAIPSPLVIGAGGLFSFRVQFQPNAPTPFTGLLSIGTQPVNLTGVGTAPPLPAASLQFDVSTFTSQQQDHVAVSLASASQISAAGTLTVAFTPSVTGVTDDPAVMFVATGGRNLSVQVNVGSQTAFYNGQSQFAFQTGTTAGKLTFTLTFSGQDPVVQTIDILPAPISVTSVNGVRQAPSLVVTLSGYDNTYSAGRLSFTFYGTNGAAMSQGAVVADETQPFHDYFFNRNSYGGAFQLQANFPVNGDVTTVGSVDVTITNTVGISATQHVTFN